MEVLRLWYSNAEKEQRNSMTGLTFLLYVSQNHFCQALYEFNSGQNYIGALSGAISPCENITAVVLRVYSGTT
jgi:hypothetical protein